MDGSRKRCNIVTALERFTVCIIGLEGSSFRVVKTSHTIHTSTPPTHLFPCSVLILFVMVSTSHTIHTSSPPTHLFPCSVLILFVMEGSGMRPYTTTLSSEGLGNNAAWGVKVTEANSV